jgi:hypothetical protein
MSNDLWRNQTVCTACGKVPDGWIEVKGQKFCGEKCAKQYFGCKKWGLKFGEFESDSKCRYLYKTEITRDISYCPVHGIQKHSGFNNCPYCGNTLLKKTIIGIGKIAFDAALEKFETEVQL